MSQSKIDIFIIIKMQTKKKPINLLQNIVYKMKKTKENVCVFIQNAKVMSYDAFVLQIHLYCDVCIIDKCRDDWSSIK